MKLPTLEQAKRAVQVGEPTKLEQFIFNNEPLLGDIAWRESLAAALSEALAPSAQFFHDFSSCPRDGSAEGTLLVPWEFHARAQALLGKAKS